MEPQYMNENRYSYLVGFWKPPTNIDYLGITAETEFERRVQSLFMEAQTYLHREQYLPALGAFRELMALILRTADPQIPVDANQLPWGAFPMDVDLVNTLIVKSANILQKTPLPVYEFPPALMSEQSILPGPVVEKLKPVLEQGLHTVSYHGLVKERLAAALTAVAQDDFGVKVDPIVKTASG